MSEEKENYKIKILESIRDRGVPVLYRGKDGYLHVLTEDFVEAIASIPDANLNVMLDKKVWNARIMGVEPIGGATISNEGALFTESMDDYLDVSLAHSNSGVRLYIKDEDANLIKVILKELWEEHPGCIGDWCPVGTLNYKIKVHYSDGTEDEIVERYYFNRDWREFTIFKRGVVEYIDVVVQCTSSTCAHFGVRGVQYVKMPIVALVDEYGEYVHVATKDIQEDMDEIARSRYLNTYLKMFANTTKRYSFLPKPLYMLDAKPFTYSAINSINRNMSTYVEFIRGYHFEEVGIVFLPKKLNCTPESCQQYYIVMKLKAVYDDGTFDEVSYRVELGLVGFTGTWIEKNGDKYIATIPVNPEKKVRRIEVQWDHANITEMRFYGIVYREPTNYYLREILKYVEATEEHNLQNGTLYVANDLIEGLANNDYVYYLIDASAGEMLLHGVEIASEGDMTVEVYVDPDITDNGEEIVPHNADDNIDNPLAVKIYRYPSWNDMGTRIEVEYVSGTANYTFPKRIFKNRKLHKKYLIAMKNVSGNNIQRFIVNMYFSTKDVET